MILFNKSARFLEPEKLGILRTFQTAVSKKQTEAVSSALDGQVTEASEYEAARPFHSIPGPKPLPIPFLGNLWRLMPFGTYSNMDMTELHRKLYDEYGPIVRMSGLGNFSQLVLFDPEDAAKMFRNESVWPRRYALKSLKHYRTVIKKDFYQGCQGLVTSQDEEWHGFRSATSQVMMQPKNVKIYVGSVGSVCDDFLERIRYIRLPNGEMPDDFLNEINKLSLENFAFVTLDTRLGCLDNDLKPDSEAQMMIKCVKEMMTLMFDLDFTWKYLSRSTWKKFIRSTDYSLEFSIKHIHAKWEKIKQETGEDNKPNRSILESLLIQTKDPRIPIVMAADTLFAAIDTTSNTLATILYYLAINPDKQEKLFRELRRLFPEKNSQITNEILNELKYTRAVIKESMRLSPTVAANQRILTKDMVLSNYQVPKGTNVAVSHSVMCKMEKHFKEVDKFLPERWLKSECPADVSSKNTHPFVYLPFGFGPRSCIGKRFAYLELDVAVSKIIRNFKVSYDHEPMTWKTKLISAPSKPLKYKMIERPE